MGEWVLSGRKAVECCYARHQLKDDYFAVILDWKMPEMDGMHRNSQTDRERIGKEITIIVLTSYEFSEIEEEAKAAGMGKHCKSLFRSRRRLHRRLLQEERKN